MRIIITFITLFVSGICSYAQNNSYLEQLFDQAVKTYENASKQQKEIYEKAMKNAKENMTATALILPGENSDSYRALAVISCSAFTDDLLFEYSPNKKVNVPCFAGVGNYIESMVFEEISLKDCVVLGQYVWLPEILKPDYTLRIGLKGVLGTFEKELYLETIPSQKSSAYITFQNKTKQNLVYLSTVFGGNSASGSSYSAPNSSGSSTNKSNKCSMCNGTGDVVQSTASYIGGTKWCSKCNKEVSEGHYHNTCPLCAGKGYN